MLLHRAEPPALSEARATTRRVARTFAIACRLLPREIRDDVYLLYLVFRTLDDLVDTCDPDADQRIAAVESWCAGGLARSPEVGLLADLSLRHPLPREAFAAFCQGMRDDRVGARRPEQQPDDRLRSRRRAQPRDLPVGELAHDERAEQPAERALHTGTRGTGARAATSSLRLRDTIARPACAW